MFIIKAKNWPIGYIENRFLAFDGKFITNGHWCCEINIFKEFFDILKSKESFTPFLSYEDFQLDPFHWKRDCINGCFIDEPVDVEKVTIISDPIYEVIDLDICIDSASYFKSPYDNNLFIIQNQYEFFINELFGIYDETILYRRLLATKDRIIIKENDKLIFMLMLLEETQDNLKNNLRNCSSHTY